MPSTPCSPLCSALRRQRAIRVAQISNVRDLEAKESWQILDLASPSLCMVSLLCRYYTEEVHRAAFVLPKFVADTLPTTKAKKVTASPSERLSFGGVAADDSTLTRASQPAS